MTKLEQLTKEIRKSVPRLMELTEGCKVKTKYYHFENEHTLFKKYCQVKYDEDSGEKYLVTPSNRESIIEIIGHEPLLSDVLEFLKGKYTDIQSINIFGLFHDTNFIGVGNKVNWDLSKPYLKDQSQELIDYLHSLIN